MMKWKMRGEYLKNCNCIASCPCDTEGIPYPHKNCEGMAAMHIIEGYFGPIRLDDLNWAGVVQWPGAMHEGDGKMQTLIDECANEDQRDALLQILSGKNGGAFFEILAMICPHVYPPVFVPFIWEFDREGRHAKLHAGEILKTASEPLKVPATGEQQRVQVLLPGGFEYKQMEVARATMLEVSGLISFKHSNSHSSLAHVDHMHMGLVA